MNKFLGKIYYKTMFVANKKYLDEILANQKKTGRKAAFKKMDKAVRKHGISKDTYVKEKYYLLSEEDLERLLTSPGINGRVYFVANKYGAPMGHVYAKALRINKKYGVPLYAFVKENLYPEKSSDKFREVKKDIDDLSVERVKELAEITGWDVPEVRKYVRDIHKKYGVGILFVKGEELFKHSDEEIAAIVAKDKADNEARKQKIMKANNWNEFDFERHRSLCRYRYNIYEMNTYDNMEVWKFDQDFLDTFAIPQDSLDMNEYYNTASTKVLDDKTIFDQTFKDFIGRKFWINRDTSLEEFKEFVEGRTEIFCKPINLLGGHGSYKYYVKGTPEEMYEHFMNEPKMLIEEVPKQHHLMSEIYDKSINSIRITTVLKDGEFHAFNTWVKFGGKGSIVDGRVGGGCFAGVDVNTGIVDTPAIDIDNNRFEVHPDTGKRITGFQIPYWKEALELTEKALRFYDGIDFVGWDLCITENGPMIVEGNSKPAFGDVQLLYNYDENNITGQRWRYVDYLADPDKWRR